MRQMPLDIGIIHFTGIGGIGMSGIAEALHAAGYKVQGSDIVDGATIERLREKGIDIFIGQKEENINAASILVYSTAIKSDNPEMLAARQRGLPVVRRAEMLAELMRLKWAIAIGGTHGKTTTTSLVGTMLDVAGYDPTIINGGILNSYGANTRLGTSDWMVVEADESDGTFTRLPASVAVVTNIDAEHLDFYGSMDRIRAAFRQFIENLPFYGFAVLCCDHPEVQTLHAEITDKRVITYGFSPQADIRAVNLRRSPDGAHFDVEISDWLNNGEKTIYRDLYLPMVGDHNILNTLSAIAIAQEMGIPQPLIKKALSEFSGVKRRFTMTGEVKGIRVIDDYGHHPVEIKAVLKSARQALAATGNKVIAVMQPHRYTRLESLFDGFCTCFNDADSVLIADVYAAGEEPIEGIDKESLVAGIVQHGHRDVQALEHKNALPETVARKASSGDFVICLGAGDITKWAADLPEALRKHFENEVRDGTSG